MGSPATKPTVYFECESCRAVVSTAHAFDVVTCACGNLTVSGRPWRPTVQWSARPGAGWVVVEPPEVDSAQIDGADDDASDGADETSAERRRIGY